MSPAASGDAARPAASERVVARLRRHARVLILPAVLLVATAGATAYAIGVVAEWWQRLAVIGVALLVATTGCLVPFLAWLTHRTTITTRRVILRRGVISRVRQELLHSRGYDVVVRRTWSQRLFGSGDVRIDTGHEHPVVLHDVPNPNVVQSALHELVEHEQRRLAGHRFAEQSVIDGDTVTWGRR